MSSSKVVKVALHQVLGSSRQPGFRVGVITDGTGRGGGGGIADGARRVVECAEYAAKRDDVELLAAFILSSENVERRGEAFFQAMDASFARLLASVMAGAVLRNVRFEIYGRLDRLKRRAGAARRLAHKLEALVDVTACHAENPRIRVVFGVDYDADGPIALGLNLLVRTGIEAPGVLRLSGLRVHPDVVCISTTTVWREYDVSELAAALAIAERSFPALFEPGYSETFVEAMVREFLEAGTHDPFRLIVPIAAPTPAVVVALSRLASGPLGTQSTLAVSLALEPEGRLRSFGPEGVATQHIVLAGAPAEARIASGAPYDAVIAPGQSGYAWRLSGLPLGYANVHTCGPTPAAVAETVVRAVRFHREHPPRLGAARVQTGSDVVARAWSGHIDELMRVVVARDGHSVEEIAQELDLGSSVVDRGLIADIFVARWLAWARRAGLLPEGAHWQRQALGYVLTGFGIAFRQPSMDDAAGETWEERAGLLTGCMVVLAASDEECSDRTYADESETERSARIGASIRYLVGAIRGKVNRAPPDVRGAAGLAAIAKVWTELFARCEAVGHPAVVASFRAGAEELYRANLSELSPDNVDALVRRLDHPGSRAEATIAIDLRYVAWAPPPVARRIRELVATDGNLDPEGLEETRRELRLLCYLGPVAPSIGAGLVFRALGAAEPARAITDEMTERIERVTRLIDYRFRILNDLAFLDDAIRGDRDRKENAWTVLVPKRLGGKTREIAVARALGTCQRVAVWLEEEIRPLVAELDPMWPSLANWIRRGVFIGRRVYEVGHYEQLERDVVLRILDEAEQATSRRAMVAEVAVTGRDAGARSLAAVT